MTDEYHSKGCLFEDVKFTDVVGQGKIRFDLEEIIQNTTSCKVFCRFVYLEKRESFTRSQLSLRYHKGGQGNTIHKRNKRMLAQSDFGSTYSSDSLNERNCMLEFAVVVKQKPDQLVQGLSFVMKFLFKDGCRLVLTKHIYVADVYISEF